MSKKTPFPIVSASGGSAPEVGLDELRGDAALALERGLAFITACKDSFALLRAHIVLEAIPVDEGLRELEARQLGDGSFDPIGGVHGAEIQRLLDEASVAPAIRGALEAMSLLADWRVLYAPAAERLVGFLASIQQEDGGWGQALDADEPSTARLFTTGMIAGFGGRTRSARPAMLHAAQFHLAAHWAVERMRRSGWPLLAAYSHFYTNVPDDNADVALPWCGRELERGYRAGDYSAREAMRVLLYCDVSALPGAEFEVGDLLARLLAEQKADGGYAEAEASVATRVGPTLDAMSAILRLCRMVPAGG